MYKLIALSFGKSFLKWIIVTTSFLSAIFESIENHFHSHSMAQVNLNTLKSLIEEQTGINDQGWEKFHPACFFTK